jgi:hypothetical protein
MVSGEPHARRCGSRTESCETVPKFGHIACYSMAHALAVHGTSEPPSVELLQSLEQKLPDAWYIVAVSLYMYSFLGIFINIDRFF